MCSFLKKVGLEELSFKRKEILDQATLTSTREILEDVRLGGNKSLITFAKKFGDLENDDSFLLTREEIEKTYLDLEEETKFLLQRTHLRIKEFAEAQRQSISEVSLKLKDGEVGHRVIPLEKAACYAPGGRYPLPSSILMTVTAAKIAGVREIWACSPKASNITIASAYLAGADFFLKIGGAQAIAAFAYGTETISKVDMIVGPGNRWVTAAKYLVSNVCGIDMLAGPSELLIVADETASAKVVAADLLAQAEHDDDASVVLVCFNESFASNVNREIEYLLKDLSTAETARNSLMNNAFYLVAESKEQAIQISNSFAPEHLEIMTSNPREYSLLFSNFGSIFIGEKSAEVFGDYGFSPNHVLPTSGSSRYVGGLSVFNFLKICTWMEVENLNNDFIQDVVDLAKIEGLDGHAQSAELRRK